MIVRNDKGGPIHTKSSFNPSMLCPRRSNCHLAEGDMTDVSIMTYEPCTRMVSLSTQAEHPERTRLVGTCMLDCG